MKKNVWMVLGAIAAIAMIAVVAVSALKGGCTEMLTCGEKQVPMKCHWEFIAARTIGIGGIIMAVAAMIAKTKEGRIMASLGTLVTAVLSAVMVSSLGIGICMKPEMMCHQTAPLVYVACAVAAIVAIVMIVKADPAKADEPKMQL